MALKFIRVPQNQQYRTESGASIQGRGQIIFNNACSQKLNLKAGEYIQIAVEEDSSSPISKLFLQRTKEPTIHTLKIMKAGRNLSLNGSKVLDYLNIDYRKNKFSIVQEESEYKELDVFQFKIINRGKRN